MGIGIVETAIAMAGFGIDVIRRAAHAEGIVFFFGIERRLRILLAGFEQALARRRRPPSLIFEGQPRKGRCLPRCPGLEAES